MSTNWTPQQLAAMEPANRLTVLSAAAGSGKTTVLVERALRLLLDKQNPVSADRILIVTFSNASARDFKSRIEKGINQKIRENPTDNYIKTQKISLGKADISTIHAFCIKLVRENFQSLELSADFAIADDAQSENLHGAAIDKAMLYGYTLPSFKKLVSFYGKSSQDKQIRDFLLQMNKFFSALPFPVQKAENAKNSYDPNVPMENTLWYKQIVASLWDNADYLGYLVQRMNEIYESCESTGYEDGLVLLGKYARSVIQALKDENLSLLPSLLENVPALGRIKGAGEQSKMVQDIHKVFKGAVENMVQLCSYLDPEFYEISMNGTKEYIDVLIDVFIYYQNQLLQLKKEQKIFEFSDFEHFALKLLQTEGGQPTELALNLREHYEYIMEDEFQDTSYIQDAIFTVLARENQSNLFVVGDVKQSIYGFRKASPEIFLEKRKIGIDNPQKGNTIFLPHNFRSDADVISAVNYIFKNVMSRQVGGVDYDANEELQTFKKPQGKVGLKLDIYAENEAESIAAQISRMIKDGYEIKDGDNYRKVSGGDFCILMRNGKSFKEYKKALEKLGYEAFIKDDELILNKPEVQSIISLLRVVSNPFQEIYLTASMFGDLFGFSLDEILKIRTSDSSVNLYKALSLSKNEKAVNMLCALKDITWAADTYSPDKLIDYICKKTGYYSRLAFSEDAGEKRENIRWFIDFAKSYAKSYNDSLSGFIRRIDMSLESGKVQSSDSQKPSDAIAIMTMHTSKGLEFPICFVCGLSTKFNTQDKANRFLLHVKLGLGMYVNTAFGYNRSTLSIAAIKDIMGAEQANEEMRLLYVALTRAKNLLVLSAQYNNTFTANTLKKTVALGGNAPHYQLVRSSSSAIQWVLYALASHPYFADLFGFTKEDVNIPQCVEIDFPSPEKELSSTENAKAEIQSNNFDLDRIKNNISFVYPHLAKTKLPIKVSVSEIAKAVPKIVLSVPDFARDNKVTSAEKGSAMHSFVQHADILLARTNLNNELVRLEGLGLIDSSLLNLKALEKFLYSEVAVKILNSQQVFVEKEFLVPYSAALALGDENYSGDELLVQGVMDCVLINDEKVTVIDYKTDFVSDMRQLKNRYEKQLELYRFGARQLFKKDDVKCIIYSFHLNDFIEF